MTFDLSKLTPAPWEVAVESVGQCGVFAPGHGFTAVANANNYMVSSDAAFIALARNAFDVMMRRGWNPSLNGDGSWGVVMSPNTNLLSTFNSTYRVGTFDRHVSRYPDPFTALVEADRWYKEHIESKPAGSTA